MRDEEEGVKGVVDGDLSLIVGKREMDGVSGKVKWLCAFCILVQLPLALGQRTLHILPHHLGIAGPWEGLTGSPALGCSSLRLCL